MSRTVIPTNHRCVGSSPMIKYRSLVFSCTWLTSHPNRRKLMGLFFLSKFLTRAKMHASIIRFFFYFSLLLLPFLCLSSFPKMNNHEARRKKCVRITSSGTITFQKKSLLNSLKAIWCEDHLSKLSGVITRETPDILPCCSVMQFLFNTLPLLCCRNSSERELFNFFAEQEIKENNTHLHILTYLLWPQNKTIRPIFLLLSFTGRKISHCFWAKGISKVGQPYH